MENKNDEEYLKLDLSSMNEDETKALISRTEKCMRLLAEAMRLENDYRPMVLFNRMKNERERMLLGNKAIVAEINEVLASFGKPK